MKVTGGEKERVNLYFIFVNYGGECGVDIREVKDKSEAVTLFEQLCKQSSDVILLEGHFISKKGFA